MAVSPPTPSPPSITMIKDPYTFEKRSISIDNKHTTVSMERVNWVVLERLAKMHRMTWRNLAHYILSYRPPEYKSRAGWLRLYIAGYAYTFLTRPAEIHHPPRTMMRWDYGQAVFKFPSKVSRFWID